MADHLALLCRNIDELAGERGWKRKDVAKAMDMLPSQLSGYLTGAHSPTLEILERIARALGVGIGRLFDEHSIDDCLRRVSLYVERGKAR